jgi:hypothetical protein
MEYRNIELRSATKEELLTLIDSVDGWWRSKDELHAELKWRLVRLREERLLARMREIVQEVKSATGARWRELQGEFTKVSNAIDRLYQ